jgi:hypothetical protein
MQLSASKALAIRNNPKTPFTNEPKTSIAIWDWSFARGDGFDCRVDAHLQ